MTKYGMVRAMGAALGLDTSHVVGNAEKPPEGGTKRPRDTTMDRWGEEDILKQHFSFIAPLNRSRVEELGIGCHTLFGEGIKKALEKFV